MDARQCLATTKSGAPCRGRALPDSEFCLSHSPDRQAALAESRRKGGAAKSARVQARKALLEAGAVSADEVLALCWIVAQKVARGQLLPSQGAAVASLTRAWMSSRATLTLEELKRELEGA